MLPKLKDLLVYDNNKVVSYFCRQYPSVDINEAAQIFKDLLGWLWISVYREGNGKITQFITPLNHLDTMWHVFILHTRDYFAFCDTYFSHYLHHEVESEDKQIEFSTDNLRELLSCCYDQLGEAWLKRNFAINNK